jgi:hypothetical protein
MPNYRLLSSIFIFVIGVLLFSQARAYPEFIAYGYSSCLTCHYNGQGGGPLNDYGRALWSAEIASRLLYPKRMSDEDIGNQSGFLGSKELPYWIRPHIKYRGLDLVRSLRTSEQVAKYYQMQTDAGATFQDPVGKYLATITFGNVPSAEKYAAGNGGINNITTREYYVRVEPWKTWWFYAGLMDKVYGLRNIDHSSLQRTHQGFNVHTDSTDGIAESHSFIVHKVEEKWEVAVDAFFGNPHDSSDYRQSGYSSMGEFEVGENKRLGASIMTAKSHVLKKEMAGLHYRQQIFKGSSLMFEYGFIQDSPQNAERTTGSYNFLETQIALTRGYFWKTTVERYNQEFKSSSPDQWRWMTGFLMFPLPRLELRAELMNSRQFTDQRAQDDSWTFLGQLHVSL